MKRYLLIVMACLLIAGETSANWLEPKSPCRPESEVKEFPAEIYREAVGRKIKLDYLFTEFAQKNQGGAYVSFKELVWVFSPDGSLAIFWYGGSRRKDDLDEEKVIEIRWKEKDRVFCYSRTKINLGKGEPAVIVQPKLYDRPAFAPQDDFSVF